MVLQKFKLNIAKNQLFSKKDKLLLAISGGADSVALAYLLKNSGYTFGMAHCNFKLRNKESDADEAFCKALADKLGVVFYSTQFDTNRYCKDKKISVQMGARELRYNWFNDLLKINKIKYLLTAHHANDNIETLFINLLRGTGINGLKGIAEKKDSVVRPLLIFSKNDLLAYLKKENITFRSDKSNLETKYERNFLRLKIIPELKKLHPHFETTLINNISNFKEESHIVNDFIFEKFNTIVSIKESEILIEKHLLKKEKYIKTILNYIIKPYGFNSSQIDDITANLKENKATGKLFYSEKKTLIIDRDFIFIKQKNTHDFQPIIINSSEELKTINFLKISEIKTPKVFNPKELIIEQEKLIFPLIIRSKQNGDKFNPFGMNGFKLVSDFIKDIKLNAIEKENCRILENGNGEILWIIGYRTDNRYKINNSSKKLLKLSLLE
jgi:tRNA(Ile)-lysidine synthase